MPDTQNPSPSLHRLAVEFIGVHKWYGAFHVLRDVSFRVRAGERVVICGPSGSGKSTLIRCVNRLEEHQRGVIRVHGVELNARSNISIVFDETLEWFFNSSISFRI
jgi:general L-amino acid transport system ATP-binding protein